MLSVSIGRIGVPTDMLVLLGALAVAALVGARVARLSRQGLPAGLRGVTGTLLDMLLVAAIGARLAFVAQWWSFYQDAPWRALDFRDGGFTAWVGVLAALVTGAWQARRRAPLRRPLTAGLVAGALAWAGAQVMLTANLDASATRLPDMRFTTLDGKPVTLTELAGGQPAVVNLWASWCPPCQREMPVFQRAQQRGSGLQIIMVDIGEDREIVSNYLNKGNLAFRHVLLDPAKQLPDRIGSRTLPTTLFYDATGRLVDRHVGPLSDASLASRLARMR